MTKPIKSLMIPVIYDGSTHQDIANAFFRNEIAIVKRVTKIPYLNGDTLYFTTYIDIEEWFDTEASYNFIKRLQNLNATIQITELITVSVGINTHYNPDDIVYVYTFTENFNKEYFNKLYETKMVIQYGELDDGLEDELEDELEDRELEEAIRLHLQECTEF
jgi:RecG-like helicase